MGEGRCKCMGIIHILDVELTIIIMVVIDGIIYLLLDTGI